jgi:hypothetical protein
VKDDSFKFCAAGQIGSQLMPDFLDIENGGKERIFFWKALSYFKETFCLYDRWFLWK